MNWIERLSEIKNKDLYSQNGEGLILEYIAQSLGYHPGYILDIGGGNGIHLSNSRHLKNIGWKQFVLDRENGDEVRIDNAYRLAIDKCFLYTGPAILSIDIDGNDYWIIDKLQETWSPSIIVAEFNPRYLDSRTIAYNPDHVWDGTDYYGFSFEAGKKLAERFGYAVIFQLADMNMFMVRKDLIGDLKYPAVTFKQNNFFEESKRTDWVMV